MNSFLIIINGPPGCGKSSFSSKIVKAFPSFNLFSYDELKEKFFDEYGFNDLEEKKALNERSQAEYYRLLDIKMKDKGNILIEYPFCKRHEQKLNELIQNNNYKAILLRLKGDWKALYERAYHRDHFSPRNPGHLAVAYHKGDSFYSVPKIPQVTLEEFISTCEQKNYNINIGTVISVDVTDFNKINYDDIFRQIKNTMEQ